MNELLEGALEKMEIAHEGRERGHLHLVNCIANQGKGCRWEDKGLTHCHRPSYGCTDGCWRVTEWPWRMWSTTVTHTQRWGLTKRRILRHIYDWASHYEFFFQGCMREYVPGLCSLLKAQMFRKCVSRTVMVHTRENPRNKVCDKPVK